MTTFYYAKYGLLLKTFTIYIVVLTQKVVVGFPVVFECQSSVRYMVQVLQPLEEGNGHTTGVNVQIWDDKDVSFDENLVSSWCSRSVGSFSNDLQTKNNIK